MPDKRTWWHPMYRDLHEDVKVTIQGRPCTWRLYWKWGASIFPSSTSSIFLCSQAKVLFWPRWGHSCKYFCINLVQKERKKQKSKFKGDRLNFLSCYAMYFSLFLLVGSEKLFRDGGMAFLVGWLLFSPMNLYSTHVDHQWGG